MNAYLYQYVIATPILVLHGVLAILIIFMLAKHDKKITRHFKKHGMVYGLVIALAAIIGSLGFSEAYYYPPCKLCWIQRIFHYPQLILFAVALYYKDRRVWTYSLWLSLLGGLVALYQVLIQFNPTLAESSVCSIVPAAESCSDILIRAFGYISIPVMSLSLFACLIMLSIYQNKKA